MAANTRGQRVRQVARLLQASGITLAKGDAARVEARLGPKSPKTAVVMEAAVALGITAREKRMSPESARLDALQAVAEAVIAQASVSEGLTGTLYSSLVGRIENEPFQSADVPLLQKWIDDSLVDVLIRMRERGRHTSLYALAEGHACNVLLACLAERAEDIVLGMDEDRIDALATIATYPQAARLIEKRLVDGGPGRSLVSRFLKIHYRISTGAFIAQHLDPRQRPIFTPNPVRPDFGRTPFREHEAAIAAE
jgi:hypothetical protein